MPRQIRTKRVHDPADQQDGKRVLVDRLWPRGLKKEEAQIDLWLREAAPSSELRRWFGHDPARWEEFRRRYAAELERSREVLAPLLDIRGTVTLLFAARDEEHNNAVALAEWLKAQNRAS
ncbi:MAG: DUF488 family protein [Alphaproteobacteria bacterium]|nr:DUF488 family protein [Alphaproteobacteria bacterium]